MAMSKAEAVRLTKEAEAKRHGLRIVTLEWLLDVPETVEDIMQSAAEELCRRNLLAKAVPA